MNILILYIYICVCLYIKRCIQVQLRVQRRIDGSASFLADATLTSDVRRCQDDDEHTHKRQERVTARTDLVQGAS